MGKVVRVVAELGHVLAALGVEASLGASTAAPGWMLLVGASFVATAMVWHELCVVSRCADADFARWAQMPTIAMLLVHGAGLARGEVMPWAWAVSLALGVWAAAAWAASYVAAASRTHAPLLAWVGAAVGGGVFVALPTAWQLPFGMAAALACGAAVFALAWSQRRWDVGLALPLLAAWPLGFAQARGGTGWLAAGIVLCGSVLGLVVARRVRLAAGCGRLSLAQAHQKLQVEMQRLEWIMGAAHIGTWEYDAQRRHFKLDQRGTGLTQAQGSGTEVESPLAGLDPEDLAILQLETEACAAGERELDRVVRVVLGGEVIRYLRVRARRQYLVHAGEVRLRGAVFDVTEAQLNLERARRLANGILQQKRALDLAALVTESRFDGTITYVNQKVLDTYGYLRRDLLGRDHRVLKSHVHGDGFFAQMWQTVTRGDPWCDEVCNQAAGGELVWVRLTIYPVISTAGGIDQFVTLGFDITESKRLERESAEAKRVAEEAAVAKSSFLANMSHEIRTPMNGILGMANLLAVENRDPGLGDRIAVICRSGQSLLTIIDDILTFSKIEAGKIELEHRFFDLASALQAQIVLFGPMAAQKNLTLCYRPAPDLPAQIEGDEVRLMQIVSNLLSNALKFTARGRVELRAWAEPLAAKRVRLSLAVEDTGIGIAPGDVDRLFQKFSQVDASTTRRFGGTGLGLSISRALAEMMGGRIELTSEVGRGTTFCCVLDAVAVGAAPVAGPRDRAAQDVRFKDLSALRVLVVDDQSINLEVACGMLALFGIASVVAHDGDQALECLAAESYDLMLLDCHMPGRDGFRTAREVTLRFAPAERPRIVAMSAGVSAAEIARCYESGMDDFLAKPLTVADLERVLDDSAQGRHAS